MKQKDGMTNLKKSKHFLESLKVQLEDEDLAAVGKSMVIYGMLIPIVYATKDYENARIGIKRLRNTQIKVVSDAILVMQMLIDEFGRSKYMRASELVKAI